MGFEDILHEEYVCKKCELIYRDYGSRKRCDICNRRLKLVSKEEALRLEQEWNAKEQVALAR